MVVSIGDIDTDVREKCGEPVKVLSVQDYGPIWVYAEEGDRFMYYLEFVNDALQRILSATCSVDDPACFDLGK